MREECACGASIDLGTTVTIEYQREVVKEWRKDHRHEVTVELDASPQPIYIKPFCADFPGQCVCPSCDCKASAMGEVPVCKNCLDNHDLAPDVPDLSTGSLSAELMECLSDNGWTCMSSTCTDGEPCLTCE